jgi:phosphoenolpyruvate synthase/pyruvate phosphate dikinase
MQQAEMYSSHQSTEPVNGTVKRYVYDFADGRATMAHLLGGKGANLAEMTLLGLPVPPGFTMTTEVCQYYLRAKRMPGGMEQQIARQVLREVDPSPVASVGVMIELLRAGLTADAIARDAEFFSFGTNDLTQTTWGLSRDDAESAFHPAYLERGISSASPFGTIDPDGVGALVPVTRSEAGRAEVLAERAAANGAMESVPVGSDTR